jgi:hypothetical protein
MPLLIGRVRSVVRTRISSPLASVVASAREVPVAAT